VSATVHFQTVQQLEAAMFLSLRTLFLVSVGCLGAGAEENRPILFDDPLGQVEVGVPPMAVEFEHSERELAPKLTREIRFISKAGPAAVLVSTRIRDDLPKDDRVLERLEPNYRKNFKQPHDDDVVLEFRGKSPDRTLEFALAGGDYQEAFPYVVGGEIGVADPPKSVTISQFFVIKDRMFEAAIFLPNSERASKAALLSQARKLCDDWRATIIVKR
jgi:hypothetical protein